jgi:2-hydroxy-6-oxonona-2,4-dienedioate hydrolase
MGPRLLPEFRSMLGDRPEEVLPRVAVPTMLVRGDYDPIAPRRWLDEAARLVGAERVAEIARWGHAVNYSAARPLVEAIAPFLHAGR